MGKLYEEYKKLQLEGNKKNNAQLIYILAAQYSKYDFKYNIEKGDTFNQFWLNTRVKGTKGEDSILLQATQEKDGTVCLSIQGLYMIEDIKNFIDYWDVDDYSIFMKYLEYF